MYGERSRAYRVFVGKPEGNRILAILSNRWKAKVNRDLKEWNENLWTGLIWRRIWTSGGLL